ncbi:unnamed protein product [Rotaria sp. Silwood1]|nr:unnamed protein product [Rotaria sp. Silwood1]CAF1562076.1 unnamed protein product [Rotaria sp. Silwood1]CAF3631655.1 unnamed protein product [Rotaria sp. Silwood1]CAF3641193.1 unnamed protein product [Rotaria sp. Silwood1]CAF3664742.1 unnamed protein product [Rotaria sp. Silwood1]
MTLLAVLYTVGALIISIVVLIYWKLIRTPKRFYDEFRRQGVPGEPFVPLIGQLRDLYRAIQNDASMAYRMSLAQKHGYVYLIGFGPDVELIVNEPDLIADILGHSHVHDYQKPSDLAKLFAPLIGTHNLLVSEGIEHERARKMLNPAFHFTHLQSMISIMTDQTAKAIDELVLVSSQKQFIDIQTALNSMTLTIIASSAFGQNFETVANAKEIVSRAFTDVLDAIEYRGMRMIDSIPIVARLPFWHKRLLDKACQDISRFVDQLIDDRRHGQSSSLCSGQDLLDLLLSAVDQEGKSFSDQEIKEQAITFVLAGHETTGNLMTWVMYVLMTHEDVWRACREEVDKVLPNGIEPTPDRLNELAICEAVLQETLRLYPPAPFFSRQCIREHTIGKEGQRQLRIPVGSIISFNTYLLHRREDFWPRALVFDYRRWLRDPISGLKPKLTHPFCYLPFAAGQRNCIGQNFALLEAKVMLAMFVQRCDFTIEPNQNITTDVRITMRAKYGLRAKVTRRPFSFQ